jgi:hypothetical protein
LILLIAIAYTSTCLKGKFFKNQGHQKYIACLTEAKREYRRHSDFRVLIRLHTPNFLTLFQLQFDADSLKN